MTRPILFMMYARWTSKRLHKMLAELAVDPRVSLDDYKFCVKTLADSDRWLADEIIRLSGWRGVLQNAVDAAAILIIASFIIHWALS